MAGAKQPPDFLSTLVKRQMPNDSLALAGVRRAIQKIARYHATQANLATVVTLIETVPLSDTAAAIALLDGISEGWPEEQPPNLSAQQRATLGAAANGASGEVAAAFGRIAARWTLPNVFRGEPQR
jgi:hypothetical protein